MPSLDERAGLAERVLSDVDRTFARIRERPFQFTSVAADVRRALLHTFPYAGHGDVENDDVWPQSTDCVKRGGAVLHGANDFIHACQRVRCVFRTLTPDERHARRTRLVTCVVSIAVC